MTLTPLIREALFIQQSMDVPFYFSFIVIQQSMDDEMDAPNYGVNAPNWLCKLS